MSRPSARNPEAPVIDHSMVQAGASSPDDLAMLYGRGAPADDDMSHLQRPREQAPPPEEEKVYLNEDEEMAALEIQLKDIERQKKLRDLKTRIAHERAEMQVVASARAAVPKHDARRDSPQTWILMPYDEAESRLAEDWIIEHCPVKKDQRMIENVLDVNQLRIDDSVICMVRGAKRMSPVTRLEPVLDAATGSVMSKPRDKFTLFADVTLTEPVACKEFWSQQAGFGRFSGQLDRNAFVCKLGTLVSPLRTAWLDANMAVGGVKPSYLILKEL